MQPNNLPMQMEKSKTLAQSWVHLLLTINRSFYNGSKEWKSWSVFQNVSTCNTPEAVLGVKSKQ